MKSITTCSLYKIQDSVTKLTERMLSYNEITDKVSESAIEEHIQIIKKRYTFPLKVKTINTYQNGKIVFAYNKSKAPIPSYIPCYLMVDPKTKTPIAVSNVTLLSTLNQERTNLNINTRQLYTLMQTATITLGCLNNWNAITMNQNINKTGADIYSKIFTKVLDRMFAVNLDVNKTDKIKFIAAKFFLINILEKTNEGNINTVANACTSGTASLNTLLSFGQQFPKECFSSFDKFIETLSEQVDGLGELNLRNYLDNYMRMYGVSALLALEYFPAFVHMISAMIIGANLNAEHIIENLIGKIADKFMVELSIILK